MIQHGVMTLPHPLTPPHWGEGGRAVSVFGTELVWMMVIADVFFFSSLFSADRVQHLTLCFN